MKLYIYYEEVYKFKKEGQEDKETIIPIISNAFYEIPESVIKKVFQAAKPKEILEHYKKILTEKKLLEAVKKEERPIIEKTEKEIRNIQLVTAKKGNFVNGEYYAHEYDQYSAGKARKITYSNGFVEYEVKCLNKKLSVLDGFWEEVDNNGCGDKFYPEKEVK
jgi:hypothetical protein